MNFLNNCLCYVLLRVRSHQEFPTDSSNLYAGEKLPQALEDLLMIRYIMNEETLEESNISAITISL